MPSASAVLDGLTRVANDYWVIAALWHLVFAAGAVAWAAGPRLSRRAAVSALALAFLSVAALAWFGGNPFNAIVFVALTLMTAWTARAVAPDSARVASPRFAVVGLLLVAFGWCYPHFLRAGSWGEFLYAAPLGLIPCPTLSAAIGITLMLGLQHSSRGWASAVAAAGLFYGAIGIFRLGVWLDWVLFIGAIVLSAVIVVEALPRHRLATQHR